MENREYSYQICRNETGEVFEEGTVSAPSRAIALNRAGLNVNKYKEKVEDDVRVRLLSLDPIARKLTIDSIMREYGLTQTKLSKRFGIPYRTIQNWVAVGVNHRECPDYILRMMNECLWREKKMG